MILGNDGSGHHARRRCRLAKLYDGRLARTNGKARKSLAVFELTAEMHCYNVQVRVVERARLGANIRTGACVDGLRLGKTSELDMLVSTRDQHCQYDAMHHAAAHADQGWMVEPSSSPLFTAWRRLTRWRA